MNDAVKDGHPSWVDLTTADVAAAKDFYTALFGWAVTTNQTPMGDYFVGSVADREVAGMMAQPPEMAGAPSTWTIYFYVDDIDATVATIADAGGRVLQDPFEIPDGARVSVVADPGGAMFALISEQPQPGRYLTTAVGAVSWFELMTRDPRSAETFYRTVFGWKATTDDAGGTPYTSFGLDDSPVSGMIETPADIPADAPDTWSVYFTVADCAATEELAIERGGQVILPSTGIPVGTFAVLADPQEAVFQIMEYAVSSA